MAMMLVLTLVEPQSSGVGGGGFFVYHDAKSGQISTIDGRETAPAAAMHDRFLDANGQPRGVMDVVHDGLSVGVPGNLCRMEDGHDRWGYMTWAAIHTPETISTEK